MTSPEQRTANQANALRSTGPKTETGKAHVAQNAVTRQIQSNDVINKLHRYEAHIERGLYRALHELQRLQAVRQGQAVPAPMALDITADLKLPDKANSALA